MRLAMRTGILFVVLLAVGFAPAPFPRPARPNAARSDLQRMQGTWDIVDHVYRTRSHRNRDGKVEIEGNRWRCQFPGQIGDRWEIQLDPTMKPRSMDFAQVGNYLYLDGFLRAIYRFEGDTLTVCYRAGGPRPDRFAGEGPNWLLILKRPKR
jgi:uncharacterized protein (TIGR03067 family)